MTLSFNIIEQKQINYDEAKKDYAGGLIGKEFREKYNIGGSAYLRLLKRFREDGLPVPVNKNYRKRRKKDGKYYYPVHGNRYYSVKKCINGRLIHFGTCKSEAEAKKMVIGLKKSNWEGLLDES